MRQAASRKATKEPPRRVMVMLELETTATCAEVRARYRIRHLIATKHGTAFAYVKQCQVNVVRKSG